MLGGETVKHLRPFHGMRLDQITRRDVASRLSVIAKISGRVTADRVRSQLVIAVRLGNRSKALFESNPTIGITKHASDIDARDRVLSDDELVAIWNALPERERSIMAA